MSTETKSKKVHSIRFELVLPTTILFVLFTLAMSLTAYFTYSNNVTKQTINQIKTMSQQVLSNYDTYFESVITISENVQVKIDNIDLNLTSQKSSTSNYFDEVMSFKSEIKNMAIFDTNGQKIVSNAKYYTINENDDTGWLNDAISDPLINIFSRVENTQGSYFFTLSKYVNYNKGSNQGVLRIDFDFKKIISLISQTDLGTGGHISIYDGNYNIVYSSQTDITDEETNQVKSLVMGVKSISLDQDYVLFASTITNTTWRVAIFTNNSGLKTALTSFLFIMLTLAIVVITIFVVFIFIISNSISNPLRQLQNEMIKVENLNYVVDPSIEVNGSKEVQNIEHSFNQMMTRIKELMGKVLEEQEEQRKSELKALQNQINPHFLYNTFDSIIYLIDKGENDKAEEMIVALSKFFRISVSKGKNIIPLEKEIEHAKYYLQIQKLRFGEAFSYDINVDPELYKYYVIKLILQPIIENAIGHGISEMSDKTGKITINGYIKDGLIMLDVIDNGYGILPEKINEIYASFNDKNVHNGVGIKNVYERIRIYYGEKANINITSVLDAGTTVSIIIPVEGAINNEEK
ncbi:MAG: sensor histidine kinase [Bacilli bacterium]